VPDTAGCNVGVETTRLVLRVGVVTALEGRDGLPCRDGRVTLGEGEPARRATALSLTVTIPQGGRDKPGEPVGGGGDVGN
jgi:hypothetical protein